MEEQSCAGGGNEEEDGQDQVRKGKRETLEKLNVSENGWVLLCRLSKEASEAGTDDRTQTPD